VIGATAQGASISSASSVPAFYSGIGFDPGSFPGSDSLTSLINFATTGAGAEIDENSLGIAGAWIAAGYQQASWTFRAHDEMTFRPVTPTASATITQGLAISNRDRDLENPDQDNDKAQRMSKLRIEDIDLAWQMVHPEHKALQMAESIFDGDDPVHQFARFLPKHTIARSDSAGEKEIEVVKTGERQVEAAKHSLEEEGPTEMEAGRGKGKVDWRYALIVPAAALVAGAIWHLGWRRRTMKKKLAVPHAAVGKEHMEVKQPVQKKKAADVTPHMAVGQPLQKKEAAVPHAAVGNPHMDVKQPLQKKEAEDLSGG
jgi:hypothetical protein